MICSKGPIFKHTKTLALLSVISIMATACLGDPNLVPIDDNTEQGTAGFFYGLLHGLLFYYHLFQNISGAELPLYDLYHNNLYDLGFIGGLGAVSNFLRLGLFFPSTRPTPFPHVKSRCFL